MPIFGNLSRYHSLYVILLVLMPLSSGGCRLRAPTPSHTCHFYPPFSISISPVISHGNPSQPLDSTCYRRMWGMGLKSLFAYLLPPMNVDPSRGPQARDPLHPRTRQKCPVDGRSQRRSNEPRGSADGDFWCWRGVPVSSTLGEPRFV